MAIPAILVEQAPAPESHLQYERIPEHHEQRPSDPRSVDDSSRHTSAVRQTLEDISGHNSRASGLMHELFQEARLDRQFENCGRRAFVAQSFDCQSQCRNGFGALPTHSAPRFQTYTAPRHTLAHSRAQSYADECLSMLSALSILRPGNKDSLRSLVTVDYADRALPPKPGRDPPKRINIARASLQNFLGDSPALYKFAILGFLILNMILYPISRVATGWAVVLEFIVTLSMALRCYPLGPGGLLAIEVVALGLTSVDNVYEEIESNLEVLLLLMFMVAATHFLKHMLLYIFTKLLLHFHSKIALCLAFQLTAAALSAFLDALTVTAVLIAVIVGLLLVYEDYLAENQHGFAARAHEDAAEFKYFLRDLMMHSIMGTALGGQLTSVGEPQNLIIADRMGWSFGEYFLRMAPVTTPVFLTGLVTLVAIERARMFGYGHRLPPKVRDVLADNQRSQLAKETASDKSSLLVQAIIAVFIVVALGLHMGPVGLIGLAAIVMLTAGTAVTEEAMIAKAFLDSMPFVALLCVFFAIVAMINSLSLFQPIVDAAIGLDGMRTQITAFYIATGVLSMISDNVFVATVYISALVRECTLSPVALSRLTVAVNSGTNVLSVATPNGQAAFLFLLTSHAAPELDLTYLRMVYMALPYTISMSIAGLLGNIFLLERLSDFMESNGILPVPTMVGVC
eukprot:506608_1